MFGYYYNKSLRKLIVGFGTLFSNIYVHHENQSGDDTKIQVPITYASQEKFIQRLLSPSSITDGTRIENQLPRISFVMNNIVADPSRRRARFSPNTSFDSIGEVCQATGNQINNEIPVNVGFNLFVYTRHVDDMLQIVEQIMPFFVPDHIISMNMNDNQSSVNIPIVMVSNNLTDRYDGDLNSRRIHISTFTFIAKSYIYGNLKNITAIDTNNNIIELD